MSNKSLKVRWEPVFMKGINSFLGKGGLLTDDLSPFEKSNGVLLDFRGIELNNLAIKNCRFENIDFSFSSFKSSWIENSSFKNCYFKDADFTKISDQGNKFEECIFFNCKFNNSGLGYKGSAFVECIFENTNFQKAVFIRAEFERCSFINSKIKGIDFNASSFEECIFEGILDDVWFRGGFPLQSDNQYFGFPKKNIMKKVSFEKAELKNLTFSDDCDLSSVCLGDNPEVFKYSNWYRRLQLLAKEIISWDSECGKQGEIFVKTHLVHAKNQDWYILNLKELEQIYGLETASKIIDGLN